MDRVYMDMAYEQAEKSSCFRAKVGAVLVKDGMVVAQGYNNMTGGINDCAEVGCIREKLNIPSGTRREVCRAICAEQLAISEAARNGVKLDGSVAYITTFPCHICAKLLVSSGVSEIVYDKDYPDELSKKFLAEAGTIIRQI
jgi:dCMP deaminase